MLPAARHDLYAAIRGRYSSDYREKKQKFSLMHKLVTRWRTVSKTLLCLLLLVLLMYLKEVLL